MKVLFAVNNEEISESIVKKYQKEYKQIISYKNVYYFNAILKELQKDKSYDRLVISEDLEAFTHTQYDQIDKFIFDKLDNISDEASNTRGNDVPIILICSDRRTKSEEMLVKLFGIGIYNAIIGTDRSVDGVCKLINRPRSKKEAKIYYKIDSDDVKYQSENENDVSEIEIQNILAHYKRLGKNEEKYIESFNNIAAQYNDIQLRIISKFLPLNVRAVLEEQSPKYQQIMSFNNKVSSELRRTKKDLSAGPSETLLVSKNREKIMSKPVVIPSSVNMNSNKKLSRIKPPKEEFIQNSEEKHKSIVEEPIQEEEISKSEIQQPVKRGRGRPKKNVEPYIEKTGAETIRRGRGRPRKNPVIEQETEKSYIEENEKQKEILPGLGETIQEEQTAILPGFDETIQKEQTAILPGFDEPIQEEQTAILPGFDEPMHEEQTATFHGFDEQIQEEQTATILPGFDTKEEPKEEFLPGISSSNIRESNNENYNQYNSYRNSTQTYNSQETSDTIDLSRILTPNKKIVTFIGTSKNGTSFIVNNLAEMLSTYGVNTAILDTTQNRNSYYIYTKNEEELRQIATQSIEGLAKGQAKGIQVHKNLTVYTSLPDDSTGINNCDKVLETLLQNHSLILIDTDFNTPTRYFEQSQEIYLVQSLDILTIQPLTAFLNELKSRGILDEHKLRVILNKNVKIRGITDKTIIGGMAYYNDPAMSFMKKLFDKTLIKYISIPFEEETYVRYLEGIIECDISLKGYSKFFMQRLRELGNMVYTLSSNNTYRPPSVKEYRDGNTFSANINNTLNQMKKRF